MVADNGQARVTIIDIARAAGVSKSTVVEAYERLVAEGAVDIAAEPEVALWDLAPLDVLVREAGGRFTALDGTPGPHGGSAVASNGLLHEAVLGRFGEARRR